ncbi:MAG: TonB-dependent receptor [Burkholderiales bacterium]|nr:TonB-dependent receptor [Burkholderiales bacterium]
MLKRTMLAKSLLVAFGGTTAFYGGTAFAQSQPATQELQRVTVTGSNIRRTDTETPSPVQVITEADIKKSGYTSISEVLQTLTANGQGTLSNAFPGAFAGSATGISLRGLNTSSTLVLIDGHRMAPFPLFDDGQRAFVDISSIPFDAIERIEVLKDGASAVYGSDAMAGVVNIILKRNFKGTSVTADIGTTQRGGGTTQHASAITGFGDLDANGWNAFVNLEYRHQDAIFQRQRQGAGPWSNLDQTAVGGINQTPGVIRPGSATPPAYGTNYLQAPGTFSAATTDFYANPIAPNAAYNGACTFAKLQAGACAFINPYAEVQPKTENINIIGSYTQKLGDSWTLGLKASLFNSKGEQYNAGALANGLVIYPVSFSPLVAESAGVAPHLVGTTIPSVTVPANYPGNTLGVAARVRGVSLDAPVSSYSFDTDSYRFAADLNGSIADWTVSGALGLSSITTKKGQFGTTNVPALYAALNRPTNPWLITGGNTAADIATVYPTAYATSKSDLQYGEVSGTRTLMQLAGGDLALNVGAQYIHSTLDARAPDLVAQGIIGGNNAYAKGTQSDAAAYVEVVAPVLKSLELDGHLRYDRLNNSLNATTPSAGFKYTPVKEFAIRGTIGRGFRAPNVAESGQAGQGYSAGTGADPLLCADGKPTTAGNVIAACNYNVIYNNSSNPALQPEKSTSKTIGFIAEPIKGWSTTLDFYQVEIKNQIVAGTGDPANAVRGAPVVSDCSNGSGGSVSCTPAVGPILYIPVQYVNANATKVSGWELDTRYKFGLGEWGNLTTELDWSHTMSYIFTTGGVAYQMAGTHGPAVIGGNTGNPKDRAQFTLTYERGPLQVAGTVNYISSFDLTDPSGSNAGVPVLTCADGVSQGGYFAAWIPSGTPTDSSVCKVHSFTTLNLTGVYKIGKNWTVRAAIDNVFDRQPPLDLNTYGGGNLPYNPSMHQAGAVGRFFSMGVTYTF